MLHQLFVQHERGPADRRGRRGADPRRRATFPAPLYKKWLEEYRNVRPEVRLAYEAVGSGEGVRRFVNGSVDFGASDAAMSDGEIARVEAGVQLIPTAAGSIVLAYNLPDVDEDLKLSRSTYVDIFLGKITRWDDPKIRADNPGIKLPSLSINIGARQDSSGTTYAFTNHLSAISDEWRDRGPGTGKVIDWPGSAMKAPGNEGVAASVMRYPGVIGYVEYGVATRANLKMAWLENKAGKFVKPTGDSGLATLSEAVLPDNLRAFFPDPAGEDSYPIVTYTWLMLYRHYDSPEKAKSLKEFVRWCLTDGQQYNEPLGYIRLAPRVASRAVESLEAIELSVANRCECSIRRVIDMPRRTFNQAGRRRKMNPSWASLIERPRNSFGLHLGAR